MKHTKRLTAAWLLIVMTIMTVLPLSVPAEAATLQYSTASNSGTRHEVCTTLEGTRTDAYYTNAYTYDALSAMTSTQLYDALNTLMTSTHKKNSTYNDCRDMSVKTDCEQNDGSVNLLYTSFSTTRSTFGGSGSVWNREHVWPKSLGGYDTVGAGADLHHVRPADCRVNNIRNNDRYGNVASGTNVTASGLVGTTVVGGTRGGGFFEPLDNAKGDVARICLYMYVRYGKDAQYKCQNITAVFQSIDTLLEWCALDPVDTWEMGRNEVVAAYQGNRNVFIDYPEYAWLIFGKSIPTDMTTPSGEAKKIATSCEHIQTELRGVIAVTCGADGYSGDLYCVKCNVKLSSGQAVLSTGAHVNTELRGQKDPTCSASGHTGDTYCKDCNTLLTRGNSIPALGDHLNTELRGQQHATCGASGHTGDTYCKDCGKLLVKGSILPATEEHTFRDGEMIIPPTETTEGLKECICTTCGLSEGVSVPALNAGGDHTTTIVIFAASAAVAVIAIVVVIVIIKKKRA